MADLPTLANYITYTAWKAEHLRDRRHVGFREFERAVLTWTSDMDHLKWKFEVNGDAYNRRKKLIKDLGETESTREVRQVVSDAARVHLDIMVLCFNRLREKLNPAGVPGKCRPAQEQDISSCLLENGEWRWRVPVANATPA